MIAGQVRLRPAVPGDAGVLSGLALRSKAHWGYADDFIEACRAELAVSPERITGHAFHYVVAEADGAVIGFYALAQLPGPVFELEALFVEPAHIGTGVGRRLIDDACRQAAARGGRQLVIQGDPNADGFYRAAGAQRTGERESGSIAGRYLPLYQIDLGKYAAGAR